MFGENDTEKINGSADIMFFLGQQLKIFAKLQCTWLCLNVAKYSPTSRNELVLHALLIDLQQLACIGFHEQIKSSHGLVISVISTW